MAGTYLKVEPAQRAIEKPEPNEKDKEWIRDNLVESNIQIENDTMDLTSGVFPTDENSDLFKSYATAAAAWFRYKWAILQSDEQGKTDALELYNNKKAGIRTALQAKPTDNPSGKKASVSIGYSSSLLNNIPGMTDNYGNLL